MSDKKEIKIGAYGGQAVIEGVMMRGKKIYAMAVRNPEGGITIEKSPVFGAAQKNAFLRLPLVRGVVAFLDSLITGTKILMRSAEIAGEGFEEGEPSAFEKFLTEKLGDKLNSVIIYTSVAISLVFATALFFLLPVFLGNFFKGVLGGNTWALGIVEGLIRMFIFLCYMLLISRMKDIQRVFQYHGAEHKTINCYESGDELTPENVIKHSRFHKRCGTSFLFLVMLISMVILLFVRTDVIWLRFVSRILLLPVIAGVSYETLRWAGRSDSAFVKAVSFPGICLQKLTTSEPDVAQIETAIAALKGVLEDEDE